MGNTPRNVTILVVDDEPKILVILKRFLGHNGFTVLTASSAGEALDTFQNRPVDIVITDIVMPDKDGLALARDIRNSRPDLPIVFMTGYTDRVLPPHLPVLKKPFSVEQLVSQVRKALDEAAPG
jgi:two-component system, cell cycle sensor histidine kinase and response regulator CckA